MSPEQVEQFVEQHPDQPIRVLTVNGDHLTIRTSKHFVLLGERMLIFTPLRGTSMITKRIDRIALSDIKQLKPSSRQGSLHSNPRSAKSARHSGIG